MKLLRTLTLIFNSLIIIGAGHGIAPLGLLEIASLWKLFTGDFQFNITGNYETRLMTSGLINAFGQAFLISSYFFDKRIKSILTITGCSILLVAVSILTKDSSDMNLDMSSLLFSLPFIGTALTLLIKEIKGSNEV